MNMSDTLHSLRRLDLPNVVNATLQHLENSYGGSHGGIPGIGEELNEQIMDEFIFQQIRGKGGYAKKLGSFQELQVQEILIHYFKTQSNEWMRNAIFKGLFGVSSLSSYRLTFLQRFISISVGVGCSHVLNTAAVWMQIHGCGSEVVTSIAKALVQDYCVLADHQGRGLKSLADVSMHFTCNFIAAATHVYFPTAHRSRLPIPNCLLTVITDWIAEKPQLCLYSLLNTHNAQLQPHRTNLWTSPTKPNTSTPVPGLVRWCTQAPLLLHCQNTSKNTVDDTSNSNTITLWSKLHLAILECIVSFPTVPGATQLELLTLGDMNRVIRTVTDLIKEMPKDTPADVIDNAVERTIQVLQVALSTGGFRCSLADLKNICGSIPSNRLLQVLSSQHLSTAPPQMHNERA